jgi:HAE1 family hydrophobic/amphiphilic exporter-1
MSSAMGGKEGPNIGEAGVKLVRQNFRERSAKQIGNILRKEIEKYPEITKVSVTAGNPIGTALFGGGKPISLEVRGQDIDAAYELALEIKKIFQSVPGTGDVSVSLDLGKPELQAEIDKSKAAFLGVTTSSISDAVKTYFYGKEATVFREKGEEYDIFLRLDESKKKSVRDLREVPLKTMSDKQIKFKEIAVVKEDVGPVEIERINQERVVKVEANIATRTLGEITDEIKSKLENVIVPQGIALRWTGMVKEQKDSFRDLFLLMLLGISLVYMVMAGQFESLLDPFIIMFAIPFAFSGVFIGLLITNNSISLISIIGMIMLVGIVVNNAIVLIDYINILRARGYELFDAIATAGSSRLRPILITTTTTILGLLPLALSTGEGHEIWNPLAWTVISGLTVSTLITLIFVPVLYSIIDHRIKKGNGIIVQR